MLLRTSAGAGSAGQDWNEQLLQRAKEVGRCSLFLEDLSEQAGSCLKNPTSQRPSLCEALSATREYRSLWRTFRRTPPVKDSLHNLLCSYSTLGSGIFSKFSLYNIIFISLLLVSYSCPFTVFSQISWKVIPTTDFHALSLHILFLVLPTHRTNSFLFIKSKWIIFQLHFKYFNFQEKDHPALSS